MRTISSERPPIVMAGGVRAPVWKASLTAVLVVAWAAAPLANGAAFFRPAGRNAKVDLVYFGNIRDRSGRPVDFVDVTVLATDLTFPFSNDSPGHYRSPDVGALMKETGVSITPAQLEIVCYALGYKETRRPAPRKAKGIVQVDCVMEEDGTERYPPGDLPAGRSWRVPASGLLVIVLSAVGVGRAARRRSTAD